MITTHQLFYPFYTIVKRTSNRLAMTTCLALFASSIVTRAATVDNVVDSVVQKNLSAQSSQHKINNLSKDALQLFSDFQLESKRIEDLNIYNAQLEKQIYAQNVRIVDLTQSLKDIALIERQISPLLLRMIQSLELFINLDLPFLLEERQERLRFLHKVMERADVTSAEKFRQVLEAYEIENEYGSTIEAYKGTVRIGSQLQEVDFLRIGRVSLLFQTLDGKRQGIWNHKQKLWEELDNRFRRSIRLGLKMAHKQTAPNLIKIPVPTPTSAKK